MLLFDMHSHILPAIDDGAEDLNESLKILKLMQQQGITDVMATPHFYPESDNLEDFKKNSSEAFKKVKEFAVKRDLPNIYLGCELLYFRGLSKVDSLPQFCMNGSKYLLLELIDYCIDETLFKEIVEIRENFGVEPVIAHAERYFRASKYRKFLKFLKQNNIAVQINADSVLSGQMKKTVKKLLSLSLTCVIASDAHSTTIRPPRLKQALDAICETYGEECRSKLLADSEYFYKEITAV